MLFEDTAHLLHALGLRIEPSRQVTDDLVEFAEVLLEVGELFFNGDQALGVILHPRMIRRHAIALTDP